MLGVIVANSGKVEIEGRRWQGRMTSKTFREFAWFISGNGSEQCLTAIQKAIINRWNICELRTLIVDSEMEVAS
jgi:hypothetical protein